jgi:hypothetical protein
LSFIANPQYFPVVGINAYPAQFPFRLLGAGGTSPPTFLEGDTLAANIGNFWAISRISAGRYDLTSLQPHNGVIQYQCQAGLAAVDLTDTTTVQWTALPVQLTTATVITTGSVTVTAPVNAWQFELTFINAGTATDPATTQEITGLIIFREMALSTSV